LGAYREAERALRVASSNAGRMGLALVEAFAKHNLGMVLAHLGEIDEALAIEREAVHSLARQGARRSEGGARIYLAHILAMAGDFPAAEREARAALDLVAAVPSMRACALGVLAIVLSIGGDAAAALVA